MQLEQLEPPTIQDPKSDRVVWQWIWDALVAPILYSLLISIGISALIEISQDSGAVSWEQIFEVVGLAYILGFLFAPLVAFTAMDYLTVFPVPSAQYLVVLVLVVAGFIVAARLRSRHAKVALRTVCFTLLPWSSLFALGPHA